MNEVTSRTLSDHVAYNMRYNNNMSAHDAISVVSNGSQDGGRLLMVVAESSYHGKVKEIAGHSSA